MAIYANEIACYPKIVYTGNKSREQEEYRMLFQSIDRTAEIDRCSKVLTVCSTDCCNYYKKHPYTMLWKKECWTCTYGDFGVDTGTPTITGICGYKKER